MPHTVSPIRTRINKVARNKVRESVQSKLKLQVLDDKLKKKRERLINELLALDKLGNLFF